MFREHKTIYHALKGSVSKFNTRHLEVNESVLKLSTIKTTLKYSDKNSSGFQGL